MKARARNLAAALAVAASLLAPAAPARAADRPIAAATAAPRSTTQDARTFDDLAAAEDDGLAQVKAGGHWTTGEIVLTVLLLIFLFPIGLIVLIIFLIKNSD